MFEKRKKKDADKKRKSNIIKAAIALTGAGALSVALLKNKKIKNALKDNVVPTKGTANVQPLPTAKSKQPSNVTKDVTDTVKKQLTKKELQQVVKASVNNTSAKKEVAKATKQELQQVITTAVENKPQQQLEKQIRQQIKPPAPDVKAPKPSVNQQLRQQLGEPARPLPSVEDVLGEKKTAPTLQDKIRAALGTGASGGQKLLAPAKVDIGIKGFWRNTPSGGRTWVKGHQRSVEKALEPEAVIDELSDLQPRLAKKYNVRNVAERAVVKPSYEELPSLSEADQLQEFIPTGELKRVKLTDSFKQKQRSRIKKQNNKGRNIIERQPKVEPVVAQDDLRELVNDYDPTNVVIESAKLPSDKTALIRRSLGSPKPDVKLPKKQQLEQQLKDSLAQPLITPNNIDDVLTKQPKEPSLQEKIRAVLGSPKSNEQLLLAPAKSNPTVQPPVVGDEKKIRNALKPTDIVQETTSLPSKAKSKFKARRRKLLKQQRNAKRNLLERNVQKPLYEELEQLDELLVDAKYPQEFVPSERIKPAKLSTRYRQQAKQRAVRKGNLGERVNKLEMRRQVQQFNQELKTKNAQQQTFEKQGFLLKPVSEVKTRDSLSAIRAQRIETRLGKERKSQRIVDSFNKLQEDIRSYEQDLDAKTYDSMKDKFSRFEKRVSDVAASARSNKPKTTTGSKFENKEYVRQIDNLQQKLDEFVTNPFVDDDVFTTIRETKGKLTKQLNEQLTELNAKFAQVGIDDKEVQQLRKEYNELLKQFASKKEQLRNKQFAQEDNIAQQIKLLAEELDGVNKDNVLQQTLDDKPKLIDQLSLFSNRKNRGVTSKTERDLSDISATLDNASANVATTKRRLRDSYQKQIDDLTAIKQQVAALPVNEGRLSKVQKQRLQETKRLAKTVGKDYEQFQQLYKDAKVFEETFEKRYKKLNDEIINLNEQIENGSVRDSYLNDIQQDAQSAAIYFEKAQKDTEFLRKVYDPQTYDNYLQVVDATTSDAPLAAGVKSSVKEAMGIKRRILEGGFVDGKKYLSLFQNIMGDVRTANDILLNRRSTMNLSNTTALVKKKQQELTELVNAYSNYKKNTIAQYDNLSKRLILLDDADVDMLETLRENIRKSTYLDSFSNNKDMLDNASTVLTDISSYKPKYKVDDNGKLLLDEVVQSKLDAKTINKIPYEQLKKVSKQIKRYKRSNRRTIAGLYFELEKRGVAIEGNDSFFDKLVDKTKDMTDVEKAFVQEASDEQLTMLRDFATSDSHKAFEQYHYHNTVNYLLNGKTDSGVNLSEELRDNLRINDNPLLTKVRGYFGDALDSNLNDRKLNEVNQVVRDINSLLSKDSAEVKLNSKLTTDGTLAVDNLPPLLPGDTYKNRNFLVKKLQKLLGVNEQGVPVVDFTQAMDLSGVSVNDRDSLKKYIEWMRKTGYGNASYNNLALGRKLNEDAVDEYSSRLYRYNFSKEQEDEARFAAQ